MKEVEGGHTLYEGSYRTRIYEIVAHGICWPHSPHIPGLRSVLDYTTRYPRMPECDIERTSLLEVLSHVRPAVKLQRILQPNGTPLAKWKVREVLLRFLRDTQLCERW